MRTCYCGAAIVSVGPTGSRCRAGHLTPTGNGRTTDRPLAVEAAARTSWTAAELQTSVFPEPPWVVPEILPVGLSIIAGRPKIGKSWLCLQLACAVGSGGIVFGRPVCAGPVVYFALEDSGRRLQKRMLAQSWPSGPPVRFETALPPLFARRSDDEAGLAILTRTIERERPRLVLVDTLGRALGGHTNQRDTAQMYAAIGELQHLALAADCHIGAIDHTRKASPEQVDPLDEVLESTAKTGAADCVWVLKRERGQRTAALLVTGRDVEDRRLSIRFDPLTMAWHLDDSLPGEQRRVLEALGMLGEATAGQIAAGTGMARQNVVRALAGLTDSGRARALGDGRRPTPYVLVDTEYETK